MMTDERQAQQAPITMKLDDYLEGGRLGHHACVQCRRVAKPRAMTAREDASNSMIRTCSLCGQPCAIPLDQAARERWLLVEGGK